MLFLISFYSTKWDDIYGGEEPKSNYYHIDMTGGERYYIHNSVFRNITFKKSGAALYYELDKRTNILFSDLSFVNCNSAMNGGGVFINAINSNCSLINICGLNCSCGDGMVGQFCSISTSNSKSSINLVNQTTITQCGLQENGMHTLYLEGGIICMCGCNYSSNFAKQNSGFCITSSIKSNVVSCNVDTCNSSFYTVIQFIRNTNFAQYINMVNNSQESNLFGLIGAVKCNCSLKDFSISDNFADLLISSIESKITVSESYVQNGSFNGDIIFTSNASEPIPFTYNVYTPYGCNYEELPTDIPEVDNSLTTGQVVAISIGCIGGAALIASFVVFFCMPKRSTDFAPL